MSTDTKLFTPPNKYPEPPQDMYYQVPERVPTPPRPKPIFPWEAHARKPTRVFPTQKPPSPPPPPPPTHPEAETPSAAGVIRPTEETPPISKVASPDPWQTYQRGNAWDEVPEIERYVLAINQSRKGKLQVLHHTSSQSTAGTAPLMSPPARDPNRRPSMKLTDFPSEIERPSLPVTPAPIRRPSFWGEERDELGELPAAEGVPKQEEWVRQFSSYFKPDFPALPHPLHNLQGTLYWRCQFCGKQNPIAKLEELQRRQSEVLETGPQLEAKELPKRDMPESESAEAVVAAAEKATSPVKSPKKPKPILKEPKFGLPTEADGTSSTEDAGPSSKGPSFNPITLVGQAATESKAAVTTTA